MALQSPQPNVAVRALESRDAAALSAWLPDLLAGDWSLTGIGKLLESGHQFRVLVLRAADGSEQLAGFAEFQRILDEGHLLGIAIAPPLQRRGLARKLLEEVLAELRVQQCRRCLLEVRRSNTAALGLYQRAGFTLDGIRKNYYPPLAAGQASEDALLYSCALRAT